MIDTSLSTREILALGFVPGITSDLLRRLISAHLPFDQLVAMHDDELVGLGLKGRSLNPFRDPAPYFDEAERQLQRADESGARVITFADTLYPERLREIWSPPISLYVRGELIENDERSIAIVGTRNSTTYGRIAAEKYAATFAQSGVTVVSGLARGIDTWSHRAALEAGGRTIAVVASGLDQIQPALAERLARDIEKAGCVITEYPFGTKALRPYFPQRNRIISGITEGTLLVESDLKGGGMITARFAFDQDRQIFALPGPVTSPKSMGTNELIRTDRARLTQRPEDVLEQLGYLLSLPPGMEPPVIPDLSIFEQNVYDLLGPEPVHIDDLCSSSGLSTNELLVTLLSLEFRGLVRQMAGKRFLKG